LTALTTKLELQTLKLEKETGTIINYFTGRDSHFYYTVQHRVQNEKGNEYEFVLEPDFIGEYPLINTTVVLMNMIGVPPTQTIDVVEISKHYTFKLEMNFKIDLRMEE